jgi:DNA-directed RNA polymerase subunit RPC12/RpoP
MKNSRSTYSVTDHIALTTQVRSRCPECDSALFYEKRGKQYKEYELAHIYPLNPTPEEIFVLRDEERLHDDVNHPNNLIPLCSACHTKFDKPRTAEDYRRIALIKKTLLKADEQRSIQREYQIEDEIRMVVTALYTNDLDEPNSELQYDPKSLDSKLGTEVPTPLRRKIKHYVTDYYPLIRAKFVEIEKESPNASVLIYQQVRTFYYKQKRLDLEKQDIYRNVVDWLVVKTSPNSIEAAEIVASFFVQNCEVLE